jgi:hypothetical protein
MRDMLLKRVQVLTLVAGLLLCAASPVRVAAQESSQGPGELIARKFDEFGETRGCDAGARLDNFAIQLQNEPASVGYVVSYGPEGEGYGTGRGVLGVITDYLVNSRGIGPDRFKTIYAGRYKEWKEIATELWIAPPDAAPPEPLRFGTKLEPFTGKFEEYKAYDRNFYDEGTGPSLSSTERALFADLLHEQTETRAVVVAYNVKGAALGAWRRAAKEVADGLQRGYKVEAERIEIIYGGYKEPEAKKEDGYEEPVADALVELWIVPKDAPPPVAAVKEVEEKPSKAIQLGSFSDITLVDEGEARRAFEGFADVLRSDEHLNACLIVRIEKKAEQVAENEETPKAADAPAEPVINDLPRADLLALIEKWRADLVKDYGISEHRFVIMTAAKDENGFDDLETWIVPHGAALPDPNAKEEPTNEGEEIAPEEVTATDEETQKEF